MIYRSLSVLLLAGALLGCATKWNVPVTHFDSQPYGVDVQHVQLSADEFDIRARPESGYFGASVDEVTGRAPVLAGMNRMAAMLCVGRQYQTTDQAWLAGMLTARVRCGK